MKLSNLFINNRNYTYLLKTCLILYKHVIYIYTHSNF